MEKTSAQSWVMVGFAWLVAFSSNIMLFGVAPLFGVIQEDLGVSFTELSLLISTAFLVTAILAIPGGLFADSLGVKKTVGIAIALMGVGGFLRGISFDFLSLLTFSAVFAVGYGLALPNLPKIVSQWFPSRMAGTASGIYATGFPIGVTLGLALSFAIFLFMDSWRAVLALWGAIGLVAAVGWWLLAKGPTKATGALAFTSSTLRRVLKKRSVWIVALISFLNWFIFGVETGWLPSFYVAKGVDASLAGVLVSTLTIGNMAGVFFGPMASDRVGLRRPFLWGFFLVSGVGGYLLLVSPTDVGWVLMPLLGFAVAVSFVFGFILPMELVEPSEVGSASGVVISAAAFGAVIGPLLTGYFRDITGDFQLIPVLLIIASAGAFILTFILPETGHRRRKNRT
ncbi:MAG: CynX/NimT family MFS transporter [Candidatus Bathyarchaeia archaeon]